VDSLNSAALSFSYQRAHCRIVDPPGGGRPPCNPAGWDTRSIGVLVRPDGQAPMMIPAAILLFATATFAVAIAIGMHLCHVHAREADQQYTAMVKRHRADSAHRPASH
jgi:hypothetical protein